MVHLEIIFHQFWPQFRVRFGALLHEFLVHFSPISLPFFFGGGGFVPFCQLQFSGSIIRFWVQFGSSLVPVWLVFSLAV